MTVKRQEALRRRAHRLFAVLLVSLNKGALMQSLVLNERELGHLRRCVQARLDYLATDPWKSRTHGAAEAIVESAELIELQARLGAQHLGPNPQKKASVRVR